MEVPTFLGVILASFYDLVNFVLGAVSSILPSFSISDAVMSFVSSFSPYLSSLGYFIPIGAMATLGLTWISAILIWYVVQFILRFIQLGD